VTYIGRFAPSPTGALHFGTLATAVASYLHARRSRGRWLVRVEDIDPPREVAGAAASILRTLERFELVWDGEVRYQSSRLEHYRAGADRLLARNRAYYCGCSRQQIRAVTGSNRYPGTCRDRGLGPGDTALRFRVDTGSAGFDDGVAGRLEYDIARRDGDFVIVRRDGLPAYHLAVVIDDADQRITDVVRGADLLDSTPLHIQLQTALRLPTPRYWHIPLITDLAGEKLSKRGGAAAVDALNPATAAARTLTLLGMDVPRELDGAAPAALWDWAGERFEINDLAGRPGPIVAD
jgi:glutamyl-Q tRNA(Asp) synthetase